MATLRNPSGGTTLAHYRSSCLAAKPDRGACQSPAASNAFLVTYPSPATRVRWRYPPEGAAERRYPALCTCWIFRASRRVLGTPCGVSRSRRRRAPAPHPRPPDVPSTPRAARPARTVAPPADFNHGQARRQSQEGLQAQVEEAPQGLHALLEGDAPQGESRGNAPAPSARRLRPGRCRDAVEEWD